MRDYLARLLENHYRIDMFPNGAEALAAVRQRPPDLLLSDVMMPKMDGFELLKAVRDDDKLTDVRVILLSARAGEESKVEGLNTGADDYLVKPFTTAELLARVRAHAEMSRSRKVAEARLRDAQKLESIGLLAGGVAHDFNNLLVGVIGNASLLRESFEPQSTEYQLTEEILLAGEAAADLTRQLLAYAGKGHAMIRPVDLSTLIREKLNLLRSSIPKEIELAMELGHPLPAMEGDATQLQQLIMNLVINGAEAIGDHSAGRIGIRTHAEGREVVLTISDTGSGMTKEVAARVFEPFFTTKFTGRGLGLAAVHGIVRSHRGNIHLSSEPGAGTTFRVAFPALGSEVSANEKSANAVRGASGRGTILVIDDELFVRRAAQGALERRGYRVLVAPGCDEAVRTLEREGNTVDLVLLDWAMPDKNGEETLSILKQMYPDLPVVLSSGYNQSEAAQYFPVLAGFIQKPYTVDQIAEAVRKAMDLSKARSENL
jgi:DNA-binding response OmpR family regulator/two-component sensor histidine kinase